MPPEPTLASETAPAEAKTSVDTQLAGLDALQATSAKTRRRVWSAVWPPLVAIFLALVAWELVYLSNWKPHYVLPGPFQTFPALWDDLKTGSFWSGLALTMQRAVIGYLMALVLGVVIGLAVVRIKPLRAGVGSLITGLQTMPSVAWLPLALLIFGLNESAILFVIVLGATPSIANGLIAGIDYTPPLLLRAGKVLGLRGPALYLHLLIPASLPSFVGGLKQGWAFAWRSLMAGELLVIIAHRPSLGVQLETAQQMNDATDMIAIMIVILIIGIVMDRLFTWADRAVRRTWGLDPTSR